MKRFWDFVDERAVVRRIAFLVVLYICFDLAMWTKEFAETSTLDGVGRAAVLASVWAPMSWLFNGVSALYTSFRGKGKDAVVSQAA